ALVSCAGGGGVYGRAASLDMVSVEQLPEPTIDDFKASDRPYRVGPFDKLMVSVFRVEDLSNVEIQVDVSGRMSFPLIGTVEVAGLTPGEIEDSMEDRLRGRFINDPQVTVNLQEVGSQTVTIGGEVEKPGLYPVIGRMTLMRAVATAEGTTEFAKHDDVMIFRTVNNTDYAALFNLKAIERGNYADPEVYPSDVVIVGENRVKRVFKDYISPFVTPIVLVTERIANQP
ncbi:MAG: polysaccharide export protein, partial [Novosphingobium sp.]|nr:polysaccharide export protein [Novosphingobium sp.]